MRKFFLFLLLLGLSFGVRAQSTFQHIYDCELSSSRAFQAIELQDRSILVGLGLNQFITGNLVKLDKNGDVLWSKIYSTPNQSMVPFALEQVQDDEFVLSGNVNKGFTIDEDHFLMKLDAEGHVIWSKSYQAPTLDSYVVLGVLNDKSILMVGDIFEAPYSSLSLIKVDPTGNIVYSKKVTAPANQQLDPLKVIPTTDGGAAVVGTLSINEIEKFVLFIKLDFGGNIQFSRIYEGDGITNNGSAVQCSDGGFVITGTNILNGTETYLREPFILKTDASGNIQWSKKFSNGFLGDSHQVVEDVDGDLILTGRAVIEEGGHFNFFMLKINNLGLTLWSRYFKGANDYGYDDVIISLRKTLDDGFLASGRILGYQDQERAYLLKTSKLGGVSCGGMSFVYSGQEFDPKVQSVSLSVENSTFTPIDLPIEIGTVNYSKSSCTLDMDEVSTHASFNVYPNPSTGIFTIEGAAGFEKVVVLDMFGRTVHTNVGANTKMVDLSAQPSGIYFVRVYSGNKVLGSEKIIVQ